MKHWQLPNKGNRKKFLLLNDEGVGHIYCGEENEYEVTSTLRQRGTPNGTELTPYKYIRKITSSVSSSMVTIHYKKESQLSYTFEEVAQKRVFYNALEILSNNLKLRTFNEGIFHALKTQLIALGILAILFGWAFISASAIESGTHPGRDLAVILLIASLGTKNIIFIAMAVFGILFTRIYFKLKNKEEMEEISFLGAK